MTLSAVLSLGALRRLTPRRPRSPRWSVCVSTARDTAWSMGVSVQTQVRVCATVRAPVCRSAEVERRGYRRLSQRLPGSDGAPALHTRVACSEGPGVPLGELHGGRGWSACIWLGGDSDRPCPSQHALLCHRGHPARHHVCLVSFLTGRGRLELSGVRAPGPGCPMGAASPGPTLPSSPTPAHDRRWGLTALSPAAEGRVKLTPRSRGAQGGSVRPVGAGLAGPQLC